MSDVGLDSTLTLDIRQALEQVARIEAALEAAVSGIRVTADASQLPGDITSAVDSADTEVDVTGDAGELTGDVESAIDSADSEVTVTGEADELTGDVTSAIDAADTAVSVTGDASELPGDVEGALAGADTNVEVTGTAEDVGQAVTDSVANADSHVEVTADTSQATSAIHETTSAASELDAAVGSITSGLHGLAAAAGVAVLAGAIDSAIDSAENMQSTLAVTEQLIKTTGGTAKLSFGEAEEAAGDLATQIGQSKRSVLDVQNILLTFRSVSGDTFKQATELAFDMSKVLGSDATGAALQLGIALNDPIRGVTRLRRAGVQLTEQQMEQIRTFVASGDILSAQNIILEEVQTQVGGTAEAAAKMTDKIKLAGAGIKRQFGEPLAEVVEELGPEFIAILKDMGPAGADAGAALGEVLRGFLEVLLATLPALGSFSTLLSAIAPVLKTFADLIGIIPDPLLRMVGALLLLNRAARLTGAAAGAVGLGKLGIGASGAAGALGLLNPAAIIAAGLLTALSINAEQAADNAAKAKAQFDAVTQALDDQAGPAEGLTKILDDMARKGETIRDVNGQIRQIDIGEVFDRAGISASAFTGHLDDSQSGFERWAASVARSSGEGEQLAADLAELREHMESIADETIRSGIETGRWTEEQARAAGQATATGDAILGQPVAALEVLTAQEEAAGAAADGTNRSLAAQEAAMKTLSEAAPPVGDALGAILTKGGDLTREFVNLAGAIGQANLSEEQLGIIAQQLGVPLDVLKQNVDSVTAAVDGFVSGVQSSLPNIAQELSGLGEDVTFQGIRDEFAQTLEEMVNFEANLATLAAFPNVQAAAAAAGPQVAAVLAQGVRDGKTQSLAEMENMALGIASTEQSIVDTSTNVYGPAFAASQANAGIGATAAFAGTLGIDRVAGAKGDAAVNIMRGKEGAMSSAGSSVGSGGASGFQTGVAPMSGYAQAEANAARAAIESTNGYSAGFGVGSAVGQGFADGVNTFAEIAADKAAGLVNAAKSAAERAARSGSPSRLFMEIGSDIGEGLAIGIEQQQVRVRAATSKLVDGGLGAAIDEIQAHLARGERIFEDFTFVGASANLKQFNDELVRLTGGDLNKLAAVEQRLARVAPVTAAAAVTPTTVNVAAGAIVVQLPAGSTAADEARILRTASDAFWGTLQDRRIRAAARL